VREAEPPNLMPARAGAERVTNVELFFDLVYVFAVTQISHYLLAHPTTTGALRAGLLLAMVWLVWVYTTWVTNWLDPDRIIAASDDPGRLGRPVNATDPGPTRRPRGSSAATRSFRAGSRVARRRRRA
jgi:Bacterial low temperature requirement A protein (LtrA)